MKDVHQHPLVSICIPTYNGAEFLEEALDSIEQQSYTNLEVIISDDASTDDTLQQCRTFKARVQFPVTILNHEPSGIADNWNHCMRHVSGTYIKFLFQDDVLKPDCITTMVALMEAQPQLGLVCCKRDIIYKNFNRFVDGFVKNFEDLQINLRLPNDQVSVLSGRAILSLPSFKNKPINIIGEPVAVLFKQSSIASIGFFNTDMFQLVDYEYWLRFFKSYDVGFIPQSLVQFRLHDTQASFLNNKQELNDHEQYYRLLYNEYFWYLHSNFKWLLLKKYHGVIRFLISVKALFRF